MEYRIAIYYTVEETDMESAHEHAKDIQTHLRSTYESDRIVGGPSITTFSKQED